MFARFLRCGQNRLFFSAMVRGYRLLCGSLYCAHVKAHRQLLLAQPYRSFSFAEPVRVYTPHTSAPPSIFPCTEPMLAWNTAPAAVPTRAPGRTSVAHTLALRAPERPHKLTSEVLGAPSEHLRAVLVGLPSPFTPPRTSAKYSAMPPR